MKKIIILTIVIFALLGTAFADTGGENFTEAIKIVDSKINCDNLSLNQLELIGDYYMEQIHPREEHERIDAMMGGEGSESLRQVHIGMAQRYYCSQFAGYSTNSNYNYGMMCGGGMMYNDNYNTNYRGNNMMNGYSSYGGFGLFGMGFLMILFWGLVIWLIYFLIKSGTNNNRNESRPSNKDESSLEIAKKRFAKGEITKKEFDEIKKELK